MDKVENLALYKKFVARVQETWPSFLSKRVDRLCQQARFGACEKVTEAILEDLFTGVVDWPLSDFNNQVDYADILLSRHAIKWLIIEAKAPGNLTWNRKAVEKALDQALRYAHEQRVNCIAISDGLMLYAADVVDGGLRDRISMRLDFPDPPVNALWWLSVHGIHRKVEDPELAVLALLREENECSVNCVDIAAEDAMVVHPKYKLPATCFAYVKHAGKPNTWKLPYLVAGGGVDTKRLPKAVQCILSNYRGAQVGGIPEEAIPDVLVRLARAAASPGKMPFQIGNAAEVYQELQYALTQLNRLDEVRVEVPQNTAYSRTE